MSATTVTAKDVSLLRQRTGAGMMDCKKALEETGGDVEKAVEYLRKKGIAKAEKRADRAASEGAIVALIGDDAKTAALVEVNTKRSARSLRRLRLRCSAMPHSTASSRSARRASS